MNITIENYEEYLIDYLHGELKGDLLQEMEVFLSEHANVRDEFELLQQTILTPDKTIVFENKQVLLKQQAPIRFTFYFKRYAAIAAMIIGILMVIYFLMKHDKNADIAVHQVRPINPDSIVASHTQDSEISNSDNSEKNIVKPVPVHQRKIKSSYVNSDKLQNQEDQPILNQIPIMNPHQIIDSNKKEIIVQQVPHTQKNIPEKKETEFVVKQNELPQNENKKTDELVANNSNPKGTLEFNNAKQPGLFKFLHGISKISNRIKKTKQQLSKTEVIVMVGNKQIINLN